MAAYYNEFDPRAAAWLRELISRGLIADGVVDERSILDVSADDLRGFTQCHFFAGIGGWSHALRIAGWPDDKPVWTGSPPCQPFSAAGLQKGKDDERHLAPHWATLIASGRPEVIFGEQVASAAVFGKAAKRTGGAVDGQPEWAWLDDLFGRLEAAHYACGASDIPAAGVGAPHIRQRTFFGAVRLADADLTEQGMVGNSSRGMGCGEAWNTQFGYRSGGGDVGLADADGWDARAEREQRGGQYGQQPEDRGVGNPGRPRTPDSQWGNADWLFCRDGKWRPVEPGTSPLAHGVPARMGRLRGYGNAIVPQVAAQFVRAFEQALRG